ncbi:hypothetical protein Ga0074812_10947 [Parafrankia irregularis]|uniref:Uncharacterized protein n=1 Tax=Parafrankia irregularis TaxID=795642 RepID=A0A0S4QME3_9ACTN|nr:MULTISPECIES: hypothetical protein [Parafrankia]CUU56827.1 hypothetical protein Ga0074812_10947 [Parafrankia irregularis]
MIWAATPVGRGARASAVSVLAVVLAVVAHVAACDRLPSLPVTACGSLLALRVCWGNTGRRMAPPRLGGLVLGVQAGLHLGFAMTEPAHGTHRGLPAHGSMTMPTGALDSAGIDLLPGGARMALLHLAAALVLAWWLSVGERLLWRAARGAAAVARRAAGRLRRRRTHGLCPLPVLAVARQRRPAADRAPHLVQLVHLVVRRGPPDPRPA